MLALPWPFAVCIAVTDNPFGGVVWYLYINDSLKCASKYVSDVLLDLPTLGILWLTRWKKKPRKVLS